MSMGASEFRQIVKSFCKEASLQNSESVFSGKPFFIHESTVWFQFLEISDICRIVIDLGMPADGISPEIAMMMLESNCSSESKYLPFLGVSEKDGHALLMLHIPLSVLRNEVSLYLVLDKQLFPVIEAWRNFFAEAGKNINDVKKNPLNPGFV